MPRTKRIPDEAVLDATARVLTRKGPHGFTLQEVGEECGLSAATLIQRFGTKKALLEACSHRAAQGAAAPFDEAKAASPLRALREGLANMAGELQDREALANGLAMLLEDVRDEQLRAFAATHAKNVQARIRALLAQARREGALERTGDLGALARTVHAAYNGALIQWALMGEGSLQAWLDKVLDPLLGRRR